METTKNTIKGEYMKIAVVSTPRTCSSIVSYIFEQKHNLVNKSEIFAQCETEQDASSVVNSFTTEDNYVVKLTSTSFLFFPNVLDYSTFSWNIFDKIILTERINSLQQYASWLLLSHAQRNHNKRKASEIHEFIKDLFTGSFVDFQITDNQLKQIRDTLLHYNNMKSYLTQQTNLPVYTVTHELFQGQNYLSQLSEILNETIEPHHIVNAKSSIDYTKFITETNLEQRIQNLSND